MGYFSSYSEYFSISLFDYHSKKSINPWKNVDIVQIYHKKNQTGTSGQPIASRFNSADLQFLFTIIFAMLCQIVLHLLGFAFWYVLLFVFNNYTSKLPSGERLFLSYKSLSLGSIMFGGVCLKES